MSLAAFIRKAFNKDMFLIPGQVSVQGAIESALPGKIDGHVRGDVRVTGMLIIGKDGSVRGNIYATDLVMYGKVYGDIFVSNKAVISDKAFVKGDVTALILEVAEGTAIEGAIRKNVTEPPEQTFEQEETPVEEKAAPKDEEEEITSWF